MKLFILLTSIILVICIVLFVLFLRALNKYKPRQCKNVWQYFVPTIYALCLTSIIYLVFLPMMLDSIDIVAKTTDVKKIRIKEVNAPFTVTDYNGNKYFYSNIEDKVSPDTDYQIKLAKRGNFAYDFSKIEAGKSTESK